MKTIYDNALSASSINLSGNVLEYEEIISSWTTSSGTYYKDINHNLSRRDVSVQVLDYVTRNVDQPSKIIETDSDNLRLFVNENKTFVINVHAESISSSTSSSSSSTPVPLP